MTVSINHITFTKILGRLLAAVFAGLFLLLSGAGGEAFAQEEEPELRVKVKA